MTVWSRIERILSEAGIEQKTAAAGGSATPKCRHNMPLGQCAICSGMTGKANRRPKKQKGWQGEITDVNYKEVLDKSHSERSKESVGFDEWQKNIEEFLGFIYKNYPQGKANDYIAAWRAAEKKAAGSANDVQTMRQDAYEHGASYDDYISDIFTKESGYHHVSNALKQRIAKKILQSRTRGEEEGQYLPGQERQSPVSTDPVDVERATPEFKSWEKNVALPTWKQMYSNDNNPDPDPDERAWDEVMRFFGGMGDQGTNWKYFYKLDQRNSPWFHKTLKRLYDQSVGTAQRRRADYDKQRAAVNVPGQQAMTMYNPNAIQMDPKKQRQIDPELFRRKRLGGPVDREKRKFMSWWDPFGFKGDIPFTDM